jgi:type VI secretion system protein VasG
MITIDLKSLVNKLNEPTRNALEGAAGICLSRTHYNVEIEHWLLKLLEIDDSDLAAVLKKFEIDPGKLGRDLNGELDRIKTGNSRAPALSPSIVDLAKNAWMLASVEYGHPRATSAHVLAALLLDEDLRRTTDVTSGELKKIPPESLREVTQAVVGSTAESSAQPAGGAAGTGDLAEPELRVDLVLRFRHRSAALGLTVAHQSPPPFRFSSRTIRAPSSESSRSHCTSQCSSSLMGWWR